MVKIHGFVYLIVGIMVVLISYNIDKTRLVFFVYIGGLLVVIGAAKLVFKFIIKEKEDSVIVRSIPQKIHQRNFPKMQQFCQYCGARNQNGFYCRFCGTRIR